MPIKWAMCCGAKKGGFVKQIEMVTEVFKGEIIKGVFATGKAGSRFDVPDEAWEFAKVHFPGWFKLIHEDPQTVIEDKMFIVPEDKMIRRRRDK